MSIELIAFSKALIVVPITLLPILNPIAIAPIFLSMTGPLEQAVATRLAKRIAINCFFLLMGALFIGSHVLDFFGISLPIVRVAGGIVVAMAGWRLLNDNGQDKLHSSVEASANTCSKVELRQHSFYPFSFPLTVGPGTIAASITIGTELPTKPIDWLLTGFASALGVLLTTVSIYLCYRYARSLERFLGTLGATVLMRLSAFIVLCIGIEIGWTGLSALIEELKFH
ncbi:MAG: MarC family protein [Burkholderiales bacterium]|nr:MarC family protein [Burkholderiales bacterium]